MINKIFKRILDKYSVFFKFLFYLKYLFLIFFIAIIFFLLIPKFFDYKKKASLIENFILQNYNLRIKEYENIKFNVFPTPNLKIHNVTFDLNLNDTKIKSKNLYIYPRLINLYNFNNFDASKIKLDESKVELNFKHLNNFYKNLFFKEKNIKLNNLNIKLKNINFNPIISINNINYSNYGYNKNIIKGKIFDKDFKVTAKDNFEKFQIKILNTGIFAEINIKNTTQNTKKGNFKGKLLNSNLKFDYEIDGNTILITNSFFRNKFISFKSNGEVIYKPYFSINLNSSIQDIKNEILNKIDFEKLLKHKKFIKKISTSNNISFKSKRFTGDYIDDLNINLSLAFGKIVYSKKIKVPGGRLVCNGEVNLIEEYPIQVFDCVLYSPDKKKFLKNFLIKYKTKNETLNIKVKGNLSLLTKKINFLDLAINDTYLASQEDLKFFKRSFEKTLLDENIFDIFNSKKLKNFILDIS